MLKRDEGRDEPILEPDIPIIDTHQHLFERPRGTYMVGDYLADAACGHDVFASVYVETQFLVRPDGPQWLRPIGEIEFANGIAAMGASGAYGPCRVAAAIVGYADLSIAEGLGDYLDRAMACAPDRFRGIRQIAMSHPNRAAIRFLTHPPPEGLFQRPGFESGLRELGRRGLTFDAAVFHNQLPELGALAARHEDTTFVLNHLGLAMALDMDADGRAAVYGEWRNAVRELACHPNVVCKVGGLGTAYWGFGFNERPEPTGYAELAAAWTPFVETGIEAFGVERCMMESNFPADGRSCGFVPLWNALKHIVRGASPAEKAALFHGTAARVYRIELERH